MGAYDVKTSRPLLICNVNRIRRYAPLLNVASKDVLQRTTCRAYLQAALTRCYRSDAPSPGMALRRRSCYGMLPQPLLIALGRYFVCQQTLRNRCLIRRLPPPSTQLLYASLAVRMPLISILIRGEIASLGASRHSVR